MITFEEIEKMILLKIPDAAVRIDDMTGTNDHFEIEVTSGQFAGKTLIQQHKMVFEALQKEMDGRIHAVKIKTKTE